MADLTPAEVMDAAKTEAMNQCAPGNVGRRCQTWALLTVLTAGFKMVGGLLDRLIELLEEPKEPPLHRCPRCGDPLRGGECATCGWTEGVSDG